MASSIQKAILSRDCEDSDEEDDDYVPSGGEQQSEDDNEDAVPGETETSGSKPSNKQTKLKPGKNEKSRKRKGGISLSDDEQGSSEEEEEEEEEEMGSPTEESDEKVEDPEKEKKKVDSLWADFMSDVTPPPKKKSSLSSSSPATQTSNRLTSPGPQKVTITKVFEFAGEPVVVKKEVDANSKAAKEFKNEQAKPGSPNPNSSKESISPASSKKPNGLNAVLGKVLGKNAKLSTLEKSRLDWNSFKKEEGVEEVLDQYKKSKGGYLERQAFLERADHRQFEKEKEMRAVNRSHKM